jgi:superfamily II DNA helicase RecQ
MGGNGSGPKPARAEPASETEAALRAALAEWRTARCRAEGVPAYIVLGNATLDAIAAAAPTSLAALGRIKGIGPAKLERYGADILGIVVGQS